MRRLLLALLLLVPLLACGGDDTDPLADEDGGAFLDDLAEDLDDGAPDDVQTAEVTLLDPGAEPRQLLRLSPPEDCEQRLRMRQELTQDVETMGREEHQSQGSSYDMTYRCTDVGEDRIEVTATYGDVDLDTGVDVPQMADFIDALDGAQMRYVFDRRGAILEAEPPDLDLDGSLGAMVSSMLETVDGAAQQSAAPLPDEAVGLGARWRVSGTTNAMGMGMRTVSEFTITEITPDRVTADTLITLTLGEGAFDFPGLPGGAEMEVLDGGFTGNGVTAWDLHGVMPIQSQVSDGTMRMRVVVDDEDPIESQVTQHQEIVWSER